MMQMRVPSPSSVMPADDDREQAGQGGEVHRFQAGRRDDVSRTRLCTAMPARLPPDSKDLAACQPVPRRL